MKSFPLRSAGMKTRRTLQTFQNVRYTLLNKYFYFKAPKEGEGALSIDFRHKQELI
jgi:hypothetical protein